MHVLHTGCIPLHFILRDLQGRQAYPGLVWPATAPTACEVITEQLFQRQG